MNLTVSTRSPLASFPRNREPRATKTPFAALAPRFRGDDEGCAMGTICLVHTTSLIEFSLSNLPFRPSTSTRPKRTYRGCSIAPPRRAVHYRHGRQAAGKGGAAENAGRRSASPARVHDRSRCPAISTGWARPRSNGFSAAAREAACWR
jgi:hypothetical protein